MEMPKKRIIFEKDLYIAFTAGFNSGYEIDRSDVVNKECEAFERFMKTFNFKFTYDDIIKEIYQ